MMRVFVSYTSKDPVMTDEKLRQVENRIKPFAKVFIDRLHNKRKKQCRVNIELCRCDVVLCLVSTQHKSQWVQKELVKARKSDKPVIKTGVDELLALDDEQLYTLLTDVEKKSWSVWLILGLSLLACLLISMLGIWASYRFVSARLIQDAGTDIINARGLFGDSWGGVNAIVSAFAFAGVIVTLFLQNRDLNLQRKEMARQREEFEKENETLKYQRFENLFYNMLNLQEKIVDGLRYTYESYEDVTVPRTEGGWLTDKRTIEHSVIGRDLFRYAFDEMPVEVRIQGENKIVQGFRRFLIIQGFSHYEDNWIPTFFDHYFRHLYRILKYVDSQGFAMEEAYKYVALLRGTLSRYELVWIYYNALCPENIKLRRLSEKYSLLKNIRKDLLTSNKAYRDFLEEKGLSTDDVMAQGFTGRDYEFYLTERKDDPDMYYIGAFYNESGLATGKAELLRWRNFTGGEG